MGPFIFTADAVKEFEWAHLYFLTAMSNKLEWAYYSYARCCQ